MSDLLAHVEGLWQAVVPQWPGFTVEVLPQIDSTSAELMRRVRQGLDAPVLLAADHQTAGRGRLGKAWHSRPGQSLTFSVALPLAPADWSGLSLALGVALAESLDPAVRLKWPNDLWWQQRKLGGILVETAAGPGPGAARWVVVGVGINLARPPLDAVQALAAPGALAPVAPAGLAEWQVGVTPGETLARVAPALMAALRAFESQGFEAFRARFALRDALHGRAVTLSDGTEGQADGVDEHGALRVIAADGLHRVSSNEVSVRPC